MHPSDVIPPLRHGAAALLGAHRIIAQRRAARESDAAPLPALTTAGDAVEHGASDEAAARAIARTWVRRLGYRATCDLLDAMQREAQEAARHA